MIFLRKCISQSRARSWAREESVPASPSGGSCQRVPWSPTAPWSDSHHPPTGMTCICIGTTVLILSLLYSYISLTVSNIFPYILSSLGQCAIWAHGKMSLATSVIYYFSGGKPSFKQNCTVNYRRVFSLPKMCYYVFNSIGFQQTTPLRHLYSSFYISQLCRETEVGENVSKHPDALD